MHRNLLMTEHTVTIRTKPEERERRREERYEHLFFSVFLSNIRDLVISS